MESRELRVAIGLRRWARYALIRHYAGKCEFKTFERLNDAAEKAENRLGQADVSAYMQWALSEKQPAKRT